MILSSETEARDWVARLTNVSRETLLRLDVLAQCVTTEQENQNLVASAGLPDLWVRHVADSAQLICHAGAPTDWLDIGTGAGFPGLVVAAMIDGPVTLAEPRRLRAQFLSATAERMGIGNRVTVIQAKAQALAHRPYQAVSARAVAPLAELLSLCAPFSTEKTRLILPKGRKAHSELEQARRVWQGSFRLEPSITDADAWIVVVEGLRRNGTGRGKAGS